MRILIQPFASAGESAHTVAPWGSTSMTVASGSGRERMFSVPVGEVRFTVA